MTEDGGLPTPQSKYLVPRHIDSGTFREWDKWWAVVYVAFDDKMQPMWHAYVSGKTARGTYDPETPEYFLLEDGVLDEAVLKGGRTEVRDYVADLDLWKQNGVYAQGQFLMVNVGDIQRLEAQVRPQLYDRPIGPPRQEEGFEAIEWLRIEWLSYRRGVDS